MTIIFSLKLNQKVIILLHYSVVLEKGFFFSWFTNFLFWYQYLTNREVMSINPLSTNIHIQILQTDLCIFP